MKELLKYMKDTVRKSNSSLTGFQKEIAETMEIEKCWRDIQTKLELILYTSGGNINWYIYFGEQFDNNK